MQFPISKMWCSLWFLGLILFGGCPSRATAQIIPADTVFRINNIEATLNADGLLFSRPGVSRPGYAVQAGGDVHTLTGSALWIGGLDQHGKLHQAAMTYRQFGTDFFPGPIRMNGKPAAPASWNKIYCVDRSMIRQQQGFADGHSGKHRQFKMVNNEIPDPILNWPGNGPVGFNATIAPYVDQNNNNRYDPEKGDYPYFDGDKACFMVINDAYGPHQESLGTPLGVELHAIVYAYHAPDNPALNNTIFVEYTLVNRSSNTYHELYLGQWVDFDIGGPDDDYVGSDPGLDMCYAYNADAWDAGSDTIRGFENRPPAQALVFLDQSMRSAIHYEDRRDSKVGHPGRNEYHYYRYSRGKYLNGESRPSPFSFTGNPCQQTSGTQIGQAPYDQRMVAGTGPFTLGTEGAARFLKLTVAFVTGPKPGASASSHREAVCGLRHRVAQIKGFLSSVPAPKTSSSPTLAVFPNPVIRPGIMQVNHGPYADHLKLVEFSGRVVASYQCRATSRTTSIATEGLSPGIYWIQVISKKGSTSSAKVLIQE